MADRLDQLQTQLKDWLRRNELDGDLHFWSETGWKERGEDCLNDARLVITTEGQLCFLLNYADDSPKIGELQDLLSSFGFWFEMGHAWSIGLYSDDTYDERPVPAGYRDKLRDERWKRKADLVRRRAGHRCQDCGATAGALEVHHCWYRYGFEPWQYPVDALRCLCRNCHEKRAAVDHDFRCLGAAFTWQELIRIRESMRELFYWYHRSSAFAFLDAIGCDEAAMREAVETLSMHKTEPGAS